MGKERVTTVRPAPTRNEAKFRRPGSAMPQSHWLHLVVIFPAAPSHQLIAELQSQRPNFHGFVERRQARYTRSLLSSAPPMKSQKLKLPIDRLASTMAIASAVRRKFSP